MATAVLALRERMLALALHGEAATVEQKTPWVADCLGAKRRRVPSLLRRVLGNIASGS
jgi:hypothetical protein